MALDRPSIVRTDFPPARRGYDRAAVDALLADVAAAVDALRRGSVGATASSQVQSILDAAEATAAGIEARAWEDAARAQAAADDALLRTRERVRALAAASETIRERLEALVAEVASLETTLGTVAAEPDEVVDEEPYEDTAPFEPVFEDSEPEPQATGAPVDEGPRPDPDPGPRFERAPQGSADDAGGDRRTRWFSEGPPAWTPSGDDGAAQPEERAQPDIDGARLVALNMALSGEPREATERYLAEHYRLEDRGRLLDEVYAEAAG